MTYTLFASNFKTGESLILDYYETAEEAWYAVEHDIEWGEDDVPEDWSFQVVESEETPEWDFNEDEGFDPYLGCYTYDC